MSYREVMIRLLSQHSLNCLPAICAEALSSVEDGGAPRLEVLSVTAVKLDLKAYDPLPKPQKERLVWEAAKDPVGLSVHRLSVVTDLGVCEVRRIVEQLHSEGYLRKKSRSYFVGWLSVDNRRARARFTSLVLKSP